ncbi:MAG: hypothetical protein PVG71_06290 [Anaerolineae bacterium]
MAEERTGSERARAWVLVQAEDPEALAQELYEAEGHAGEDEYVVVRADVVTPFYGYNVVVPVDAQNEDALNVVREKIWERQGVSRSAVLNVKMHVPYPPQDANGFITEKEAEAGAEEVEKIGRQHASPGLNAWG